MKKRLVSLLTLAALFLPMQSWADTVQCLVLTESDGTVNKFALADAPVVTYSGSEMVVTCGAESLTVGLEGLKLTYGEMDVDPTRIDETIGNTGEASRPQLSFGEAQFEGLQPGASVRVYSLDGKTVGTVKADSDGRASVSLASLPKGVYILRTPTRSFKIKN